MDGIETYYSLSKVAELLPVSRQMVYKMHELGKFPNAVENRGAVRVPASDVRDVALNRAQELKDQALEWERVVA